MTKAEHFTNTSQQWCMSAKGNAQ